MRNISFDNPYFLLAIIPLVLLILIPFAIAIRKANRNRSTTATLMLHLAIAVCVTLALAGLHVVTVMTETQVYVVADVSYSGNRHLDTINSYVVDVKGKLPLNSEMGVVCFGKDQVLHTEMGAELTHIQTAAVDNSATDIAAALNFTADLFDEDVIKRVVLITDGKDTDPEATGQLIAAIENLAVKDIYLDVVYVDNNIPAEEHELQISGVDFTASTYLNHETTADVLIRSNRETRATAMLYQNGALIQSLAIEVTEGYNVVNFALPTDADGSFDYRVVISAGSDASTFNNAYSFHQTVVGDLQLLLVTDDRNDVDRARALYGEQATIKAYVHDEILLKQLRRGEITDPWLAQALLSVMPCSVEELCVYDEIMISDVDVRELDNYVSFVDSVDKVVSQFGKSLVTMGDLCIQNKTDDVLRSLEDMLPVKFGNDDREPKLYAIVIDTSRSMENFSRLVIAKRAAAQLLYLLQDDDHVMIVNFWGDVNVLQVPTKASNRERIIETINAIEPYQGTMLGTALDKAGELMKDLAYDQKQIMLISDGASYTMESDTPADVVADLYAHGITTSVIHPAPFQPTDGSADAGTQTLQSIVAQGGGEYYSVRSPEDLEALMFADIADDLTESVIEKQTPVVVERASDETMKGVTALPDIMGYAYAKAKSSAMTVLSVQYTKSNGHVVEAPLYAYWNYGNGRVSSFTSRWHGDWTEGWQGSEGDIFLSNVLAANTPEERVDHPYTLTVNGNGITSRVEMIPVTPDLYATAVADVVLPGGERLKAQTLAFDGTAFTCVLDTAVTGQYKIEITYTYANGAKVFESETVFHVPYSPEYDSFAVFDPSPLHAAVRDRGTITEGAVPELTNDDKEIATYTLRFTVPLMILAVILYVIDIIIRKLKMTDIKSFFKIGNMRKGGDRS